MPDKKITDYDAILGANTASGDLFEIVDISANDNKKITRDELKAGMSLNLVDNTSDADKPISTATQSALDAKVEENASITGATKTKITYDAKGLVTAGADIEATDLPSGIDATKIADGSVTNAEFQYLGSVTSDIQTQLNSKQATITGAATTIDTEDLTASRALVSDGSGKVAVSSVTSTELGYLNGVTSAVQTQLNGKEATITAGLTTQYFRGDKTFQTLNKISVGLGNVDNTSDASKPISTATQTALNLKEDTANKSTSVTTDQASNTKYPSVKSVYDWATGLFATIVNLALKTDKLITVKRENGASYTLILSDADKLIELNNGSGNTLTVPPNSSVAFAVGTQIIIAQHGQGQTTIVEGSGVTIRSSGGKLKLTGQYSGGTLIKIGSNDWYLFGDIAS